MSKKHQKRVVTATEASNRFGEIIDAAFLNDEHLIIKRDGVAVVAIVPMTDYEALIGKDDVMDDITHDETVRSETTRERTPLATFLNDVHDALPDVSEDEVDADIREAIRAVRATP